jgi:hypothetical protein
MTTRLLTAGTEAGDSRPSEPTSRPAEVIRETKERLFAA